MFELVFISIIILLIYIYLFELQENLENASCPPCPDKTTSEIDILKTQINKMKDELSDLNNKVSSQSTRIKYYEDQINDFKKNMTQAV